MSTSLKYQIMSITVSQLNSLADHFGFNIDVAREYLGMSQSNKRGRPSKQTGCVGGSCKIVQVNKSTVAAKAKSDKPQATKRGKTGYQLFMNTNHEKIGSKLKAKLKPNEKLGRGAVLSAVGVEWRALSESQKGAWNSKAAKM